MPTDRAELHDVAAQHPEIVQRLSQQWHDMAANVLMARGKEVQPAATEAMPKLNPAWSQYGDSVPGQTKPKGKGKKKAEKAAGSPP